jgi:V-type H+-transporting ATPase subunit E
MNDFEAKQCQEAIHKFIKRQGEEKVATINKQRDDEFNTERNKHIEEEKQRIITEYNNRLAQDEIKLKIQRSATENMARIQKMKTVNTLIEKLYKEAKTKMIARQSQDKQQYKDFLKNLIVQGLIKLMEAEVHIKCRKSDVSLVQEVYEQAGEEYKQLMKREVKLFKDRDVPLKIVIEQTRFLPEYDDTEGAESCMGGILLHARKGRIVCSNTIDERLQLVYQEAIPEIRTLLFPSFKKPEKAPEAVVKKHGHH